MVQLPRTHARSARCSSRRIRTASTTLTRDPRFRGWWPSAHPDMRSFLGVPVVAPRPGDRRGLPDCPAGRALVLRRRRGPDRPARCPRRDRDRERAAVRAQPRAEHRRGAQPARARTARLGDPAAVRRCRSRRLRVGPGTLLERDPSAAAGEVERSRASSRARRWRSCERAGSSCARPRWRRKGLASVLRKHVDVLRRVSVRGSIELGRLGDPPRLPAEQAAQVFRIAQEALQERAAARGRGADRGAPRAGRRRPRAVGGRAAPGFDVTARAVRGRRLGLTSSPACRRARGACSRSRPPRVPGPASGSRSAPRRDPGTFCIADDHAVVRQGLRTFLDLQDDVEVVESQHDVRRHPPTPPRPPPPPSAASPTTSTSSCRSRNVRRPWRTTAWSSAIRTRITAPPDRHLEPHACAGTRGGRDLEPAPELGGALLHRGQAEPPPAHRARGHVEAAPVVGHLSTSAPAPCSRRTSTRSAAACRSAFCSASCAIRSTSPPRGRQPRRSPQLSSIDATHAAQHVDVLAQHAGQALRLQRGRAQLEITERSSSIASRESSRTGRPRRRPRTDRAPSACRPTRSRAHAEQPLDHRVVQFAREPVALLDDAQLAAALVEPRVLDRDRGVGREQADQVLVVVGELGRACLSVR